MTYENITSRVFIARLENNFNIDYSDHHARVAEWVAQAIGLLKIPVALSTGRKCIQVIDHRAKLPCDIKLIEAISYKGSRIQDLSHIINGNSNCDLDSNQSNSEPLINYYQKLGNGWISTSFANADAKDFIIYYKHLAVEYDDQAKVYYPIIPNSEPLLDAIDYFLLMRILQRGHVHSTYNIGSPNAVINPMLIWESKKKQARCGITVIDPDTRKQLSIILSSIALNPDAYYNQFFNNKE